MKLKTYAKFLLTVKSPAVKIQTLNKIKNYLAKFDFEAGDQEGKFAVKFGSPKPVKRWRATLNLAQAVRKKRTASGDVKN
jgi:hypothetical protein